MIQVSHLFKNYSLDGKNIHALRDINFFIAAGEFISIIGPSGSGKSTLLHLLGGLDRPTKGEILFHDENIFAYNDARVSQYRNFNVGFIFQQFHLQEHLNLLENVELPLYFCKKKKNSRNAARKALMEVDLFDRWDHKPTEVSGGQAQRAGIARAIVNDPQIILADEPTGDLDSESSKKILQLLRKLQKEKGITLIIVTHDENIAKAADRVLKLDNGKIVSITHA